MLTSISLLLLEEATDAYLEVTGTFLDFYDSTEEFMSYFDRNYISGREMSNGRSYANIIKPVPKFEAFRPSGIRVTLPDTKGISEFFLWGNINVPMEGKDLGEIMLSTYEATNGLWLIEDMDVKLKAGDTIYYTYFININGVVYRYEREEFTIKEIVERPITTKRPHKPSRPTTAATAKQTVSTTTTTTTPITTTTPTTAIPKVPPPQSQDLCFDNVVYINLNKDDTVVSKESKSGEVKKIQSNDCNKLLVVDIDNGHMLSCLILLCIFLHQSNAGTIKITPHFEVLYPKGIRVTLKDIEGITEFFLWGNINVPMEGKDLGEIMLSTYEPTNGIWMLQDNDIKLKDGDTIYYTFFVTVNGVVHRFERQEYKIKEIAEVETTRKFTTDTTTRNPITTKITTSAAATTIKVTTPTSTAKSTTTHSNSASTQYGITEKPGPLSATSMNPVPLVLFNGTYFEYAIDIDMSQDKIHIRRFKKETDNVE
ncbi:hypothetical protein FQA39_LY05403 [Lamprigera yunnana]|nr:hypothetical protein FQA39_LY05403 [Lamprigera yunnana]